MGFDMNKSYGTSRVVGHNLAFLIFWTMMMTLTACKGDKQPGFSYGPEVPADQIQEALLNPIQGSDPSQIKLGEFVHFAETQTIANNPQHILSDTGQTVVERNDLSDRIVFTVIEHQITYGQNQNKKVSRELELTIAKPAEGDSGKSSGGNADSGGGSSTDSLNAPGINNNLVSSHLREVSTDDDNESPRSPTWAPEIPAMSITTGPQTDLVSYLARLVPPQVIGQVLGLGTQTAENILESQKSWVTYHNLKIGFETVAPPEAVANQTDCLGIPSCKIRLHHIAFDQVQWLSPTQSEKLAFEFTLSVDVPYLARLLDKCVTFLASLGEKKSSIQKVVVRQCSPVVNFRFEGDAKSNAEDTSDL